MGAVTQHFLTQVIDNDLTEWEKYCHEVSFSIPHGLVLPEKASASNTSVSPDPRSKAYATGRLAMDPGK
jgi:hypothetical protein